jgi:predicted XRE-type DNA-binding protein
MKKAKKNSNVFETLGFSETEAANLEARSRLMIFLEREIQKLDLPQSQVAHLLGVKPPRISELIKGRIDKFSVDLLITYLDRLGKKVEFKLTRKAA